MTNIYKLYTYLRKIIFTNTRGYLADFFDGALEENHV